MKLRFLLVVASLLLTGAAFAASPFSIYFNTETTGSCFIDNVTNVTVLPDGNLLATTSATPHVNNPGSCGVNIVTGGSNVVFTSPLSPSAPVLTNTGGLVSFTFTASNATSCTGAITGATGGAFTGGITLCSGSTCNSAVSAPATFPANTGATNNTYNVAVTCTGTASPATSNATVTVQHPTTGGAATCQPGLASDITGVTALCSGALSQHTGGGNHSLGSGNYTFNFVFGGGWPGTYSGYAQIFTLTSSQYLSIPFTPSPGNSIAFGVNTTYMPNNNAVFSISTQQGLFNGGVANGTTVLCANRSNPSLITSSNNYAQANCKLDPTKTYWLNMVPGSYINGFNACAKTPCNIAVEESVIN